VAVTIQDKQLPCGVTLAALVVQVAEEEPPARPAHQSRCPYCQEALRKLAHGWDHVQELTREPVSMPPELTARIMARVRALARQVADFIVLGQPRGTTSVSHAVITRTVARHAAAVPGVVFASARPTAHHAPEPGRLGVAIRLVVSYGPPIEQLARAVRERVRRRVPRLTGAELSSIDISVDDIAD
jgi:Asp23 family, cell envelope-related function